MKKFYTIQDVLMNIHERQVAFYKADTKQIVNPYDYLKKISSEK